MSKFSETDNDGIGGLYAHAGLGLSRRKVVALRANSWSVGILILFLCLMNMNNSIFVRYSFAKQQPRSEHRDAIEGVIKDFVSAWNHDDADALVSLFLSDGEMKSPSQEAATSRAGIRELLTQERKELFKDSSLKKDIRRIMFPGPDQATVEGVYELSGVEPGMGVVEVSIKGDYTLFLEKHDHSWLIKKCDIRESDEE